MNIKRSLQELVDGHAPFLLRDDKGKIIIYDDYKMVYYDILQKIYNESKRGFLSLSLFIHSNYDLPFTDAVNYVEDNCKLDLDKEFYLINWSQSHTGELYHTLRDLIVFLQDITGAPFKDDQFKLAYTEFTENLIIDD